MSVSNILIFLCRLRKRIRFAMPGRPLSEIRQMNLERNGIEPHSDEENRNNADASADDIEPLIGS